MKLIAGRKSKRFFDRVYLFRYDRASNTKTSLAKQRGEHMKKPLFGIIFAMILTLALTSILMAAEANFAGTWKLNLAKSQLSGTVYTLEKKPSGVWHYSGGGFDTDFDLAGKEFTMPSGMSIIGKELNSTSWELSFRMSGKAVSKSRVTLSGDSLMWVSDMTNADGKSIQQTSTDTRVSGGPGFTGKWKSGDPKGAPTTMQITMEGANGITIKVPEAQQSVKGSLDGRDNLVMQAGQASKFTNAFSKTGPNTLKITTKLSGKVFAEDIYTISADGKTLTDDSTATATNEKTKSVFERQ